MKYKMASPRSGAMNSTTVKFLRVKDIPKFWPKPARKSGYYIVCKFSGVIIGCPHKTAKNAEAARRVFHQEEVAACRV
jgi:hypothetical protein